MIRLSIPLRQALSRLSLPVLIAAAFGPMLLGKADALLAERARMRWPMRWRPSMPPSPSRSARARRLRGPAQLLVTARRECPSARGERAPAPLAGGRAGAGGRERPAAQPTALDAGARAGLRHRPRRGRWRRRLCPRGAAGGRAAARRPQGPDRAGRARLRRPGHRGGTRTARVLLITDMNSRIPVMLERSRARAILVGTNGPRPRLMHWPEGTLPPRASASSPPPRPRLSRRPAGRRGALDRGTACRRSSCSRSWIGWKWCGSSTRPGRRPAAGTVARPEPRGGAEARYGRPASARIPAPRLTGLLRRLDALARAPLPAVAIAC